MDYPALLGYTAQISLLSAALQTFVCGLVGYGFARFSFPLRRVLFALVVLTIIVPVQTYLSPLYMLFRFFRIPGLSQLLELFGASGTFKLIDSPWPFWLQALFGMGFRSGLCIFIFRQFYRGMPSELEEAALIDGCGGFGTYFRVMLPNARASMITVFIFSVVWHWNDYYVPAVFSETRQTVATALASLRSTLERLATQSGSDQLMVQVQVQAGALRTRVKVGDLRLYESRRAEKKGRSLPAVRGDNVPGGGLSGRMERSALTDLDLRGMAADEAMPVLD